MCSWWLCFCWWVLERQLLLHVVHCSIGSCAKHHVWHRQWMMSRDGNEYRGAHCSSTMGLWKTAISNHTTTESAPTEHCEPVNQSLPLDLILIFHTNLRPYSGALLLLLSPSIRIPFTFSQTSRPGWRIVRACFGISALLLWCRDRRMMGAWFVRLVNCRPLLVVVCKRT